MSLESAPSTTPERLPNAAYLVLGLIAEAGEATPYDLKRMAAAVSGLWTLRHDQVYREPERLARLGLLEEEREKEGRRRRRFRVTAAGRKVLSHWLATPTAEFTQLSDPGLLQLLLGAEPAPLARVQLEMHAQRLREYEQLAEALPPDAPEGGRLALEAGIGHEREWVSFWARLTG